MKEEIRWAEVVDKDLHGYQISTMGGMRSSKYKRPIPISFDRESKRSVMLICIDSKKKKFFVRDLLYQTFKITRKVYLDDNTPEIDILKKPEQLSSDEDDYGSKDCIEWKKIRKQAKRATEIMDAQKRNLE